MYWSLAARWEQLVRHVHVPKKYLPCTCPSVCLSTNLAIWLPIQRLHLCLCVYHVCLPTCPFDLPFCLQVPICLSGWTSVSQSANLPACLPGRLSCMPAVCLSIDLYVLLQLTSNTNTNKHSAQARLNSVAMLRLIEQLPDVSMRPIEPAVAFAAFVRHAVFIRKLSLHNVRQEPAVIGGQIPCRRV